MQPPNPSSHPSTISRSMGSQLQRSEVQTLFSQHDQSMSCREVPIPYRHQQAPRMKRFAVADALKHKERQPCALVLNPTRYQALVRASAFLNSKPAHFRHDIVVCSAAIPAQYRTEPPREHPSACAAAVGRGGVPSFLCRPVRRPTCRFHPVHATA
jgi:hypothetical protein